MKKTLVNVLDDPFQLYDYCIKEGYTDVDFDTWYQDGGKLSFFDGDPDIIKVDGDTGYFCDCGNVVFFWLDDFTGEGERMLQAFFEAHETGVTLGGYSWISGKEPEGVNCDDDIQNWDAWENIENGIAWRGGAGYTYTIYDYAGWVNQMAQGVMA